MSNEEAFEIFKSQVKEKYPDWEKQLIIKNDFCLKTWFKESDCDIKKSMERIKKAMDERSLRGVEKINEMVEFPAPIANEELECLGKSYDGNLVFFYAIGKFDSKKIVDEFGLKDELYQKWVNMLEKCLKDSIEIGKQYYLIHDFDGFSFRQITSIGLNEVYLKLTKYLEAHSPFIQKEIIINAPKIFSLFLNICKPFLSTNSVNKINVNGSDVKKWKEVLLKYISEETLTSKVLK